MRLTPITLAALVLLPASAALAGDDCHAPRDAWQPREAAIAAAAGLGWRVDDIEADDGCWEIEGLDSEGHRIKAKFDPATLELIELRHRQGDRDRQPPASPSAPPANPLFQSGTPPVVHVN